MPESNANAQHTPANQWTLQEFTEINGQPWMALQEHAADGSITRQLTGFEHELRLIAQQNNITPRVLPPISEEQFYANLSNSSRDYELGRQFAADARYSIHRDAPPFELNQFTKGVEDREFEQKIRAENQTENQSEQRESLISIFEQYGLDTGFHSAAEARAWAEGEVAKIYPVANQTLDSSSVQRDATASNGQTHSATNRQGAEPEHQREDTSAQSFGMAV